MTSKRVTCSITSLIFAVFFSVIMVNRTASITSAAEWPTYQDQGDKPVEQTRKNIQVLKGLPDSQLFILMNFMATSIGVKCDYCHVRKGEKYYGGNWVWESDEKEKKLIGRQMIKMVLDLNRSNFSNETRVTCYTCHRGSTLIANLPPLPPHDPVPNNTVLPTVDQILAKYVAAVGGKEAVAKFKTTVMKGTIERSENRNAQLEVTLKDPDRYLTQQTSAQGVSTLSLKGQDDSWAKNSSGSRKLSGPEVEATRRVVTKFYAPFKIIEPAAQMKVTGTEKVGDREAYVVTLVIDPDTTKRFFFDTQTGLLVREITTKRTMLAPLPDQTDYEDYRDVDGIKLPFIIRTSNTSTYDTVTRRITEIKHNVAVSDDVFNLPATPR
jgi:hypothetical protein